VIIRSEAGGKLNVKLPFPTWLVKGINQDQINLEDGILQMETVKGQLITFTNGYE
jgi:hypothetical protein